MDDVPIGLLFLALFVLLVCSGFFSISETSMMALNRYRLKHLVREGSTGARLTARLLQDTDRLLGVILLGNNLVNSAAVALVTVISVRLLGNNEVALSIGTVAVTFAILIFSEITPKVVGASYPEKVALPAAFLLAPLQRLLAPIIWFANLFVQALLRLIGLKIPRGGEQHVSVEELRTLVTEVAPYMPKKHHSMLSNLFDLEKITVDDVMRPRTQIEAVDLADSPERLAQEIRTCYHTRLPVYEETLDNIVGILHVRKVLGLLQNDSLDVDGLKQVIRPPYFIPRGTPLFTQLQHFQENHRRIGLVVDEYGELLGLVTLEDIIEEIIGEFTTHAPEQSTHIRKQSDGSWMVDGSAVLRDLNRKMGLTFSVDGPKTLNGLILEHFQDIPDVGTSLKIEGVVLEVVQTQGRVVRTVKLVVPEKPPVVEEDGAH